MNLFQLGSFTLHSGERSGFKIECDALTEADWEGLAAMISDHLVAPPGVVIGVPTGGAKLAAAMNRWHTFPMPGAYRLIVDDVLTTGASITAMMRPGDVGFVVFSRGRCPPGVRALFQMPIGDDQNG